MTDFAAILEDHRLGPRDCRLTRLWWWSGVDRWALREIGACWLPRALIRDRGWQHPCEFKRVSTSGAYAFPLIGPWGNIVGMLALRWPDHPDELWYRLPGSEWGSIVPEHFGAVTGGPLAIAAGPLDVAALLQRSIMSIGVSNWGAASGVAEIAGRYRSRFSGFAVLCGQQGSVVESAALAAQEIARAVRCGVPVRISPSRRWSERLVGQGGAEMARELFNESRTIEDRSGAMGREDRRDRFAV